jgi:hypothetical protein
MLGSLTTFCAALSRARILLRAGLIVLLLFFAATVRAELTHFHVESRTPFAGGKEFGAIGAYEYWTGKADFAIDPTTAAQSEIIDLAFANKSADGLVHFSCDVSILAPRDPKKGNGILLHEINNRGGKLLLSFFNDAAGSNTPRDAGNGYLFEQGYTLLWCGWNAELQPGSGRLLLYPPSKSEQGEPITGLVRYEWTPEIAGRIVAIAGAHHGAYPPTENGLKNSTLTWRLRPSDPRVVIPRTQYRLRTMPNLEASAETSGASLPVVELELPAGLQKGYLYELIYEATDPIVSGVGFAAVRDLTSALKHAENMESPLALPKRKFQFAIGFGVSQSGRFLREMLYSGFNRDEKDRIVFDGLIPHVAGAGMGSFNHRFAQPTAFATPFQKADWHVDRFPFAYETQRDPISSKTDGLLRREKQSDLPKIMHTQSATEYWSRGGSLVHTDPLGKVDAKVPENVRIYAFGGTQHSPATYPPGLGDAQTLANPGDYRPMLRGLLKAMSNWLRDGTAPPPSLYPRIDQKQLGTLSQTVKSFPAIPTVRLPESMMIPSYFDLGPRWEKQGIIDTLPPKPKAVYGALTPLVNEDGNEIGCLLPPEVAVPLATHTGWSLRSREAGAQDQIVGLVGSYILFPLVAAEASERGDSRRSIEERYGSLDEFTEQLKRECQRMAQAGYLLEDEIPAIVEKHRQRAAEVFDRMKNGQ